MRHVFEANSADSMLRKRVRTEEDEDNEFMVEFLRNHKAEATKRRRLDEMQKAGEGEEEEEEEGEAESSGETEAKGQEES